MDTVGVKKLLADAFLLTGLRVRRDLAARIFIPCGGSVMDLQERIEQLERKNQRMKRLGCVALLCVAAAAVMGQAPAARKPQTVEAERFVVVDGKGKHRATLGMQGDNPTMVLADSDGKPLMTLRTFADGRSALLILDPSGTPRAELALGGDGPLLRLFGSDSEPRVDRDGAGSDSRLALYLKNGKPIFKVRREKLELFDAEGKEPVFSKP